MKHARQPWLRSKYPLIDAGLDRNDCLAGFHKYCPDRMLPRSACVICPYCSNAEWMEMPDDELAKAVQFDKLLRAAGSPRRRHNAATNSTCTPGASLWTKLSKKPVHKQPTTPSREPSKPHNPSK